LEMTAGHGKSFGDKLLQFLGWSSPCSEPLHDRSFTPHNSSGDWTLESYCLAY
jgi:hypothetical protein